MLIIKRYPNRKLYDTDAKRYITLDGIAKLIKQGAEVKVVDHTTDEDLTAVTLTQIIFEQEKKKGGFLPTSVLTGLVQAGGQTMNTLRKTLTSPLDLLRQVDEEIEKRLQNLINRGEMALEDAQQMRDKLLSLNAKESISLPGQQHIDRLLGSRGIPSRDDLSALHNQIDSLSAKIDTLLDEEDLEE
ncbi:MAG: pesticidal protein Cry15Aa [Chloroflexi bacterium]|nr:pesticidal protein Cry15Aa [Chloroflexota bacterium]